MARGGKRSCGTGVRRTGSPAAGSLRSWRISSTRPGPKGRFPPFGLAAPTEVPASPNGSGMPRPGPPSSTGMRPASGSTAGGKGYLSPALRLSALSVSAPAGATSSRTGPACPYTSSGHRTGRCGTPSLCTASPTFCGNSTPGRSLVEKRGPGGGRRGSGAPCTRSTKRVVPVGRGRWTRRIGSRGTPTTSWSMRSPGTRRRRRPREPGRDAEDAGGARAGTSPFDGGTLGRESCGSCGIRPFPRPTTRPRGICGCGRCPRSSPAAVGAHRGLGTLCGTNPDRDRAHAEGERAGGTSGETGESGAPPGGFVREFRPCTPLHRQTFHRPARGTEFPIPKARVDYLTSYQTIK